EIAVVTHRLGSASALACLFSFGEHYSDARSHGDGTKDVRVDLMPAPDSVQPVFTPHPGVTDDLSNLIGKAEGFTHSAPLLVEQSKAHQVWRVDYTADKGNRAAVVWATIRS